MSRVKKTAGGAAVVCAFIGGWEGLQYHAYKDVIGVPTICYGQTKGVKMGMTATKEECDASLIREVVEHEEGLLRCMRGDLPINAHFAFVSWTYNVGVGNACKSTLVKKANAGDVKGACNELLRWNRAGGVVFRGLTRRREAERELCLRGL
jgi:lysozyme